MENNRIEKLLALILLAEMKNATIKDKIVQLNIAGFSNVEIADLIQTTPAIVSQTLYMSRQDKTTKTSNKASKKPRS